MFAIVPCESDIPPGESVTIKAIFSPDYNRLWPFLAAFRIGPKDQASKPGDEPYTSPLFHCLSLLKRDGISSFSAAA